MPLLSNDNLSWDELKKDWKSQCDDDEFEVFADGTFKSLGKLVCTPERSASVLGVVLEENTVAICQVNTASIKGYDNPVLRVRHILLSPHYDLHDVSPIEYGKVLVAIFNTVFELSNNDEVHKAVNIKFHLRSVTDQQFFSYLGEGLQDSGKFKAVQRKGAWLYVTKK